MRVESLAVHVVHGRAKVYGDEDGVRQVKEESGDKVRVACSCGGSMKDLEGFVALYGRSDTCRHQMWQVYRFAPQNWMVVGLPVWASKSGGIRCGQMVVEEGTWRHREAYVEAKRSPEGGILVRGFDKKLHDFTLKGYLGCMLNRGCFGYWLERLYI